MEVTTTQQQEWLLYFYNECGMRDSDRIQRSIDGDPVKQADYRELVDQLDLLNLPQIGRAHV